MHNIYRWYTCIYFSVCECVYLMRSYSHFSAHSRENNKDHRVVGGGVVMVHFNERNRRIHNETWFREPEWIGFVTAFTLILHFNRFTTHFSQNSDYVNTTEQCPARKDGKHCTHIRRICKATVPHRVLGSSQLVSTCNWMKYENEDTIQKIRLLCF